MLDSEFHVDLPDSEEVRPVGLFDRIASLGRARPQTRRVLAVTPTDLIAGMCRAVAHRGVGNVLTATVGQHIVYLDARGDQADLDAAQAAMTRRAPTSAGAFQQARLILDHRHAGMHLIIDVEVRSPVPPGTEELRGHIVAKIDALDPVPGETARAYADRVRAFAADEAALDAHRLHLDQFTQELASSFAAEFGVTAPRVEPACVRIVQVQIAQMGAFRDLGWREDVREPVYRPVPRFIEGRVYSDPFIYFYWDPYHDYLHWNLLDAMLHEGALRSRHVRVVEAGGTVLFNGEQAGSRGRHSTGTLETVSWDPSGNLRIGPSIPHPPHSGDPFGGPVDWEPSSNGPG